MTDIDLTPTNEAAARALFAEDAVQRTEKAGKEKGRPPEEVTDLMRQARGLANRRWERGDVDPLTLTIYRERALAITLASWKDVARQAWIAGALWAMDDDRYAPTEEEAQMANPYKEARP